MQLRVARQTGHLEEVVAFYRDSLGLPELGRFADHEGYDGVMLGFPGTEAHLELTRTAHGVPPEPHPESLLVLYLGSREQVARRATGLPTVPSLNPYWDRCGITVVDPDGFRVVLVWEVSPLPGA